MEEWKKEEGLDYGDVMTMSAGEVMIEEEGVEYPLREMGGMKIGGITIETIEDMKNGGRIETEIIELEEIVTEGDGTINLNG